MYKVCTDFQPLALTCMLPYDASMPDSDYDVPLMSAEEGNPGASAGRPTGKVHLFPC